MRSLSSSRKLDSGCTKLGPAVQVQEAAVPRAQGEAQGSFNQVDFEIDRWSRCVCSDFDGSRQNRRLEGGSKIPSVVVLAAGMAKEGADL